MCQIAGFLRPVYSCTFFDSVLIWEYAGHRKPLFWHILRSVIQDKTLLKFIVVNSYTGDIKRLTG